jgi:hypothetical protein
MMFSRLWRWLINFRKDASMPEYYLAKDNTAAKPVWEVCMVLGPEVHFFGKPKQTLGNDYLTRNVEFGLQISMPVVGASLIGDYTIDILYGTTNNYTYIFSIKSSKAAYSAVIHFARFPTKNCQLCCFGAMENLLKLTTDQADVHRIMRECCRKTEHEPRMILLDVKNEWVVHMDKIFHGRTRHKHPYASTNGTSMCLYIVTLP